MGIKFRFGDFEMITGPLRISTDYGCVFINAGKGFNQTIRINK